MQNNEQTAQQNTAPTLNKQQRKNRKKHLHRLKLLIELWPQTFNLNNPKPLASGTAKAVCDYLSVQHQGGLGALRFTLKRYTTNIRYLRALAAGGPRYNLKGEPEGEVTPEQRDKAKKALSAMKEQNAQFRDEANV